MKLSATGQAICRKGGRRRSQPIFPANLRIPTFIDARYAIARNEIKLFDQSTVITG
jgi:hypothetical protein